MCGGNLFVFFNMEKQFAFLKTFNIRGHSKDIGFTIF
jgi:hypothetical protein